MKTCNQLRHSSHWDFICYKCPNDPPTNKNIKTYNKSIRKISNDKNVTVIAINIPIIPNKLPCLDVSGDDKASKSKNK